MKKENNDIKSYCESSEVEKEQNVNNILETEKKRKELFHNKCTAMCL